MNAVFDNYISDSVLAEFSDEELARICRERRDYRAFEVLNRRYRSILARFLRARYALQFDQLEDAVQMTFTRVWKKIDLFDQSRAFRPWLFQIATTQTIDMLRASKREPNCVSLDASTRDDDRANWAEEIPGRDDDPSWIYERFDMILELRRAMAQLPQKFRQVLEMVFFQGLTRQSVADSLNLDVSTVSRRVARALEQLGALLGVRGGVSGREGKNADWNRLVANV